MAITGTGTEQDPFIVHDYSEIYTALHNTYESDVVIYVKLANDINCNGYGADWEWETVTTPTGNQPRIFDLDGHTIKNLTIKTGNTMFTGYSSSAIITIKNGKLLNIFGGSIISVLYEINLDNVSVSFEVTVTNCCIKTKQIKNSAIYGISLNCAQKHFFVLDSGSDTIKNLDLYLEMYGANASYIFSSGASNNTIDSVRVSGKMVSPPDSYSTRGTYWSPRRATNSVFNVDMTGMNISPSSAVQALLANGDNTTVVNWDLITDTTHMSLSGYLKATAEQMTVGSELRSLGFLVVNVEE